jgi:hypothetical protein
VVEVGVFKPGSATRCRRIKLAVSHAQWTGEYAGKDAGNTESCAKLLFIASSTRRIDYAFRPGSLTLAQESDNHARRRHAGMLDRELSTELLISSSPQVFAIRLAAERASDLQGSAWATEL